MKSHLLQLLLFIFIGLGGPKAFAQVPQTELWMLSINSADEIRSVELLSQFNPKSYNNQAVFMDNSTVLMTSEITQGNTDIVMLNLKNDRWTRLTKTLENEYSPRPSGKDFITTVRVEQDQKSQVLWEYPKDASNNGSLVLENYDNIGYYHALNNMKMALFVIEKTPNLHVINLRNQRVEFVTKDIGRCFQVNKTGELLFIKNEADPIIKAYNPVSKKTRELHNTLAGSSDFVLYGDAEVILMAKGAQIFKYNPTAASYILLWDLSEYGIKDISRMDYKDGKLLIINNPN